MVATPCRHLYTICVFFVFFFFTRLVYSYYYITYAPYHANAIFSTLFTIIIENNKIVINHSENIYIYILII